MNSDEARAKAVFLAAIEDHSEDQWPDFLDEACGDDAELRQQVEKLLDSYAQLGSFSEQASADQDPTLAKPLFERPGTQIGPYRLLRLIGEGGMGVVYRAEQRQPIERQVALKIIKPGMATQQVIARFDAERNALARMDHVNIAHVLDAGATDSGRPYFVMELVEGMPITAYCDQQELSIRGRMELFASVCHAVQHAHQKGVIHRDIKPSNVLVTEQEGNPTVKVIDFGVAKAIGRRLTDNTASTSLCQLVGTPMYMSPEQAGLSGQDVDTRTDIYALGVLLYELLTGQPPLDRKRFHQVTYEEIRRVIREEEPPCPSARIATLGEAVTTASGHRQVTPAHLRRALEGELDWIVMKALEKDRARRYETASGFGQDIERYLNDEPVEACPPSAVYRFRKFARRNKALLTTTALVAVALIVGTGVATWQALRANGFAELAHQESSNAERARMRAEQSAETALSEAAISNAVVSFLTDDLLSNADPSNEPNREIKLREVLDRTAQQLDGRFAGQPLVEATIHLTLAKTYHSLGHYREAERHGEKALEIRRKILGPKHPETLKAMEQLGRAYLELGHFDDADELIGLVFRIRNQRLRPDHEDTLTGMNDLANLYIQRFRFGPREKVLAAEKLLTEALAIQRNALGESDPRTLQTRGILSRVYLYLSRLDDAESLSIATLQKARNALGKEHPVTIFCQENLAFLYGELERFEESEELHLEALETARRVLGPHHSLTMRIMDNLGVLSWYRGAPDETLQKASEILQVVRNAFGAEHRSVRLYLNNIVDRLKNRRRYGEAARLYRDYFEDLTKLAPGDQGLSERLAECSSNLTWLIATAEIDRDCLEDIVRLAAESLENAQRNEITLTLGVAHYRLGEYRSADLSLTSFFEGEHRENGIALFVMAMVQWQLGQHEEARAWYERGKVWVWDYTAGGGVLQLGTEAAQLLEKRPPLFSVLVPLPNDSLSDQRPFFDGEHLVELLDAQATEDPQQLADRKRILSDFHSELKIVNGNWKLTRIVFFPQAVSAHFNPHDGCLYVGRRDAGVSQIDQLKTGYADGLYAIDGNGRAREIALTYEIGGIAVDHCNGDVYYSQDFRSTIKRVRLGCTQHDSLVNLPVWTRTYPVGMVVTDDECAGPLLKPGHVVTANHGARYRRDEVRWFCASSPSERGVLYGDPADKGPLHVPLDVAFAGRQLYIADREAGVFRLRDDQSLERVETADTLNPTGIATDPVTGNLLVVDAGKRRLISLDKANGEVKTLVEGLNCDYWGGAGIDVAPDGSQVFYTEHDTGQIVTLTRRAGESSLFALGLKHAARGECEEAVDLFTKVIAQEPEHALAYSERGFARAQLDQLEAAERDWATATKLDPAVSVHYSSRGDLYYSEGDSTNARKEFGKSLQLDPNLGSAHAGLADIALKESKFNEAITAADRAIQLAPTHRAYVCRALARVSLDRWSEAGQDLTEAIRIRPGKFSNWYCLCVTRLATGDLESYRNACRDLVAHYESGRSTQVVRWQVAECCKLAPIDEDMFERVVQLARNAVADHSDNHQIAHQLAGLLYRNGEYQESLELLQHVWNVQPWDDWPHLEISTALWLSLVQARLGNSDAATQFAALTGELMENAELDVYRRTEFTLLQREVQRVLPQSQ